MATKKKKEILMDHEEKYQVEFLPYHKKSRPTDTLLKLFQSEYFTMDMLIEYLYKRFDDPGIQDYLLNKVFNLTEQDLDFYLPQLCYMSIKRDSNGLERLLRFKTKDSIPLYIKIFWNVTSFGAANNKVPAKKKKVDKLAKLIENDMINGVTLEHEDDADHSFIFDPVLLQRRERYNQEKELRSSYNTYMNKFVNNLIKQSLALKGENPKDRKPKLKESIIKANRLLEANRKRAEAQMKAHPFAAIFSGVFLPFSREKEDNCSSNMLVKILEECFTCFNTKKRVPYKIVIETIDINDLKKFRPRFSNDMPLKRQFSNRNFQQDNSYIDWEIIENVNEDSLDMNDPQMAADQKRNKYKDLANFAHKIEEDEIKKKEGEQSLWSKAKLPLKFFTGVKIFNPKGGNKEITAEDSETFFEEMSQRRSSLQRKSLKAALVSKKLTLIAKRQIFDNKFPPKQLLRSSSFSYFHHVPFPELDQETSKKTKLFKEKLEQRNKRRNSFKKTHDDKIIKFLIDMKSKERNMKRKIFYEKVINILVTKGEKDKHKDDSVSKSTSVMDLSDKRSMRRYTTQIMDENKTVAKSIKNNIKEIIQEDETSIPEEPIEIRSLGPWEELWEDKYEAIQLKSPFGHFPSYRLRCIIVKGGDDLRQELLAMQIIKKFKTIFEENNLNLYLRPYEIIVTSPNSGILEFIPNTFALDGLKRDPHYQTLRIFYEQTWVLGFEEAQKNFVESLAAYCLVCYLLQIKDRHNGNILIDAEGHLIHIDYGFMLAFSPGNINFESAPFKLTMEYIELLDGSESHMFLYFKMLLLKGFMALRKHVNSICNILHIMMEDSDLPCFQSFDLEVFRARFKENSTDAECMTYVQKLIEESTDNWRTRQYDNFQKMTNGIPP